MEIRLDFNDRMLRLNNEIVKMGVLVEESLDKALDCLINMDLDLAREIVDEDKKINDLEIDIEDHCIVLIAREQPVASDLRKIITALKISTQLERMGDHSVHIAKGVLRLSKNPTPTSLYSIPEMTRIIKKMLQDVLTAYVDGDEKMATAIASRDAEIDSIHDQIISEIFKKLKKSEADPDTATTMLFINRFIERLGDHITNICEWIIYSKTGDHKELG